MKVIFKQSLNELSARINAPIKEEAPGRAGGDPFQKLLRDISPFNSQEAKNTQDLKGIKGSLNNIDPPDTGPMASYKAPLPQMLTTPMERLGGDHLSDKDPSGGVKTPTLLEAKRFRAKTTYEEISHTQQHAQRMEQVQKLTTTFGTKHGIDPTLALAVAEAESSFNSKAVSSDGHESKGLFQLLDKTGKDMMGRLDFDAAGKEYDPFNPELNSELGISYLRYLHDLFNKETKLPNGRVTVAAANSTSLEKLAVAAYNAGEGRVSGAQHSALKAGKDPSEYSNIEPYLPEITQRYVQKVTRLKNSYGGNDGEPDYS